MIYAIVVIYNRSLRECDSIKGLEQHFSVKSFHCSYKFVVYDNSLESQLVPIHLQSTIHYLHDATNGGVASAYNYALSLATSEKDWLLLLDQDSNLSPLYLQKIIDLVQQFDYDSSIAAIVPHVVGENNYISPCVVHLGGRLTKVEHGFTGIHKGEIVAINSGMAVRASFVKSLGGFNHKFWLDYLDYWLCHSIYAKGKSIYIDDTVIEHDLSVSNYNLLSLQRVANILCAEALFYKKYKPYHEQVLYFFRLLFRALKQLILLNNKNISFATLRAAFKFTTMR